jgi:GNAT superfamily N-acetyltransferase
MPNIAPAVLSILSAEALETALPDFAALLHACVLDGASVGFILPFPLEEAAAFWRNKVLPPLRDGGLVLLAMRQDGRLVGTVQLDCAMPPNQPHRAEVRKLLVHPECRRQGLARALMMALEDEARARRRSLLTLDTRTGDKAEPLYSALGYETTGIIPGFCRDTLTERLDATTIMYKTL